MALSEQKHIQDGPLSPKSSQAYKPTRIPQESSVVLDQIRQGACACFVFMSQQVIAAPDHALLSLQRRHAAKRAALRHREGDVRLLQERVTALEARLQEEREGQRAVWQREKEALREREAAGEGEKRRLKDALGQSEREKGGLRESLRAEQEKVLELQAKLEQMN